MYPAISLLFRVLICPCQHFYCHILSITSRYRIEFTSVSQRAKINKKKNIFHVSLFSEEDDVGSDLTNKLEMKEKEVSVLQDNLKSASDKIRHLQREMRELSDNRQQQQQQPALEQMEEEHSQLRTKLQQSQLELDWKDRSLREATSRLEFSSSRLGKMEEFLNSQQLRILSLENTLQETEKVAILLK